ncbi:MAG: hypothetical protein U0U46_13705 [Saprospiraceae bacterium]|nr:hypothetical protein [Saprospiraceae bacterium]HNL38304.1 hypothetical protein [Saprospiraceae bacterium]
MSLSVVQRTFILLLTLHLFAGKVLLDETAKLPFLWIHFQQTRAAWPGESFSDYLRQHYADQSHRKADPEHHHLPFFSAEISVALALKPDHESFAVVAPPAPRHRTVFAEDQLLPSDFRAGVLQPPEACI